MGLLHGHGGHSVSVDDTVSDTYMLISITQEGHHFFSFAFLDGTKQHVPANRPNHTFTKNLTTNLLAIVQGDC